MPIAAIVVGLDSYSSLCQDEYTDIVQQASVVAKMAAAPLIGILMIIGFRDQTTLFPRSEKSALIPIHNIHRVKECFDSLTFSSVLSFTAFLLSGTPSAINQLVATQIFAKEGQSTDTVSTFLLAQCECS